MFWVKGEINMARHSGRHVATVRAAQPRHLRAVAPTAPWEQAPRWGWLYATLLIIGALSLAAEVMTPTVGWRRLVDVLTAVSALGSMAIWLKLNRLRPACQDPRVGESRARRVIRSEAPAPFAGPLLPRSSAH
jgi:hypothetical protein